jgi:RNase P subunit RPR2
MKIASFVEKIKEHFPEYKQLNDVEVNSLDAIQFEREYPAKKISIKIIGPCCSQSLRGKKLIFINLISHRLNITNPALEMMPTSAQAGWEDKLQEKVTVLEHFIDSKVELCDKCGGLLFPEMKKFVQKGNKPRKTCGKQIVLNCSSCNENTILESKNNPFILLLNSLLRRDSKIN